MTLDEATRILQEVGAIEEDELIGWSRGSPMIYLDGEYSVDELEALAVWMRAHQEVGDGHSSGSVPS